MNYKSTIIIPREGVKCACLTPIWRHLNGEWQCLNDALSDAIRGHDDNERERIVALAESTKQASIEAWLREQQASVAGAWTGGGAR